MKCHVVTHHAPPPAVQLLRPLNVSRVCPPYEQCAMRSPHCCPWDAPSACTPSCAMPRTTYGTVPR
eukprot:5938093-Prorocentrum_lima.AAC.1